MLRNRAHSVMGTPPFTLGVICILYLFTIKTSEGLYIQKGDIIFKPGSVVPKGSIVHMICTLTADPCKGQGEFVFDINEEDKKPAWANKTFSFAVLTNVTKIHNVVCYLECDGRHVIHTETLTVGNPPDQPTNISCSLEELSSEMLCTWDTGKETELITSYDVHVENLQAGVSYNETKNGNSIRIKVNQTWEKTFHIQVTARNQLNYSVSDVVLVQLPNIVVPITPVISDIEHLQSTFLISISWRKQTSERQSCCEVQYTTPREPSWKQMGQNVNLNNSFEINKTQNADFLRVRCKEEIGNSYWSNWSAPFQVPLSAPAGTPNVWRILGPEYSNGTQEVTILIEMDKDELSQRAIKGYQIFYLYKENMTTLRTCSPLELQCVTLVPKGVNIFITALNSKGDSPKLEIPTREDSELPQPRYLSATSLPIQVQWESPHSPGESLLWYILQWNPDTCNGKNTDVTWQKISKDRTHFTMNGEQHMRILLYAVYSSGISQPSRVDFKPEGGPNSITTKQTSHNTLLIQWSEVPECKQRGVITTYTLYVTDQSSGKRYKYNSEARHFEFPYFYRNRPYLICISASTKAGEGPSDSCTSVSVFEQEDYIGLLLGTCLSGITLTALTLALFMIRKRIKSVLRLWLPKYLCEEYPNVMNSEAAKSLQEKQENCESFPNPSYSDPEITDVQEDMQVKYPSIIMDTTEIQPLLPKSIVEPVPVVDPLQVITDDSMEEQTNIGPLIQTTTEDTMVSGYRPQPGQLNLQSEDVYFNPSHFMDIHSEALKLEGPTDHSNKYDTFQIDFSLFQGMDLQVLGDGADENASLQVTDNMSARQKCGTITDILNSRLVCHLALDCEELPNSNPYFPQMFARGT